MAFLNSELCASILANGRYKESACSSDVNSDYAIDGVYWAGKTSYCDEVVIAHSPTFGKVLFLDNELQSSEYDEAIYHEHLVHPILAATADIHKKHVLVVGGGEGATVREVLKWDSESVAKVTWVDIDGQLVDLCRCFMKYASDNVYNNPRVSYYADDICNFLQITDERYDVIILDLPDPDVETLIKNQHTAKKDLYSERFMAMLKSHMKTSTGVVTHTGPVHPGMPESTYRSGLAWVKTAAADISHSDGASYHTFIPSFQSEWGFWMNMPPIVENPVFPTSCSVMCGESQTYAFTWPRHWTTAYQKLLTV